MCKMRLRKLTFILFFVGHLLQSQTLPVPYNLDFEIGEVGKLPKGWFVPSYADKLGYIAYLTNELPKSGKYCLELYRDGKFEEGIYGSVMQSIDAKPYRGKTIRFRAYIRAEIHSPKGSAHIWVRERIGTDEESGFFEYLPNQPCVLREWEVREIVGTISPNADVINFGLLLFGNGRAWIDSASFEVIPQFTKIKRDIVFDEKIVDQLVDLAKVYGVVRYFSPLSEFNFNWECFLYNSVKFILESNQTISKKIEYLFEDYLKKDNTSTDFDSSGYISWVHYGFPSEKEHPYIFSKKVNNLNPLRKYQGIVQQVINVQNIQGKNFIYYAFVSGFLFEPSSKFVLAVRFDDINNKQVGYLFREFSSLPNESWEKAELSGKVPENAAFAKPAIILVSEGNIFVDDVYFGVSDDYKLNLLQNNGFELSKDSLLVFNWRLLDFSSQSGYFAFVTKRKFKSGEKSLNLYTDPQTRIFLPSPNESIRIVLSDGGIIEIPISLSFQYLSNLRMDKSKYEHFDCHYNLEEQISQFAILIDMWNFVVHFNQYFKLKQEPISLLRSLLWEIVKLKSHSNSRNTSAFIKILEKLVANIEDDLARVIHRDVLSERKLPFLWKYINSKVFITKVENQKLGLEVGDEIIEINYVPIKDFIDSISIYLGSSSIEWKYLKALAYIRNFWQDDTIRLTVKKSDGAINNVKIEKSLTANELIEERPDRFEFLNDHTVYLDLTRLTEKELKDILDTLKHSGNFIFDLRGFCLVSEQFLSLFTTNVIEYNAWKLPVYSFPNNKNISYQIIKCKIVGKSLFNPKGIYFLVDERTVGIGEVIADIVKKYRIGTLVGSKTGGNPMEMVSKIFPDGVTLFFGIFKVFSISGEEIFRRGIEPNIPVKIRTDKEHLLQDQILQKVLFLVNSR